MWSVFIPNDRDEVPDGVTEDAGCWRLLGCWVGRVAVLKECSFKCIDVEVAIGAHVTRDQPLDGFNGDLGMTVAMWEGDRAEPVMYSPVCQEALGSVCCELRPTIGCQFVRDSECSECLTEDVHQSLGSLA